MLSRAGFPGRASIGFGATVVALPATIAGDATGTLATFTLPAGVTWPASSQSVTLAGTIEGYGAVSISGSVSSAGALTAAGWAASLVPLLVGQTATLMANVTVVPDVRVTANVYVDSVAGSDANAGNSPDAPLATIAAAQAMATGIGAGCRIALKRGSMWREQLTLGDGYSVWGYGSPLDPLPRLDCTDIATGWTPTGGTTNVQQITWTHALTADRTKRKISLFEDGVRLKWVASTAACDAEAGTFHVATTGTSPTQVVYVHPTGSGDPDTNGKQYEITVREYGLFIGANYDVRNIWTSRNGHHNGSFEQTGAGYAENVLSTDGVVHNQWVAAGSTHVGCVAYRCEPSSWRNTTATLFVTYNENGGTPAVYRGCYAYSDSATTHTGFYAHANFGNVFNDAFEFEKCYYYGNSVAFAAGDTPEGIVVRDCFIDMMASRPNNVDQMSATKVVADNVVILNASRLFGPVTDIYARDVRAQANIVSEGAVRFDALDAENCTFVSWAGGSNWFKAIDGRAKNFKNNIITNPGTAAVSITDSIATSAVSGNVYALAGITQTKFEKGATAYAFTDWQTLGYDANSAVIANSTAVINNAANNDWSFAGTIQDSGGRTAGSRKHIPRPNWAALTAAWGAGFIGHDTYATKPARLVVTATGATQALPLFHVGPQALPSLGTGAIAAGTTINADAGALGLIPYTVDAGQAVSVNALTQANHFELRNDTAMGIVARGWSDTAKTVPSFLAFFEGGSIRVIGYNAAGSAVADESLSLSTIPNVAAAQVGIAVTSAGMLRMRAVDGAGTVASRDVDLSAVALADTRAVQYLGGISRVLDSAYAARGLTITGTIRAQATGAMALIVLDSATQANRRSGGVLAATVTDQASLQTLMTATCAAASNAPVAGDLTAAAGTLSVGVAATGGVTAAFTSALALTYAATGLPPGVTLTSAGAWSGAPSAAGTYEIAVTATDSRGVMTTATGSVLVVVPITASQTVAAGSFVTFDIAARARAATYTVVGSLPAWATLDADLGEVYGLATAGTHNFTIAAGDARIACTVTATAGFATVNGGARLSRATDLGAGGPGTTGLITLAARVRFPLNYNAVATIFSTTTGAANGTLFRLNANGQLNLTLRNATNNNIANGSKFSAVGTSYFDGLWHTFVAEANVSAANGSRYVRLWVDGVQVALTDSSEPGSDVIDVDAGGGYTALSQRAGGEVFGAAVETQWVYANFGQAHPGTSFTSGDPLAVGSPQFFFGGSTAQWTAGTNRGSAGGAWTVTGTFTEVSPAPAGSTTPIAYESAAGFGRFATGGRGLTLYTVTTTAGDTSAGSLRWALAQAAANGGGRIKITAEGAIRHSDFIRIEQAASNLTIDARHSPGWGVWLERCGLLHAADNVIVRGFRSYPGSDFGAPSTQGRDGVRFDAGQNVIYEGCDFAFALDETLGINSFIENRPIANVTFQNCIVAESPFRSIHDDENNNIDEHSMGIILGRATGTAGTGLSNVTFFNNLFSGLEDRLPLNTAGVGIEFINNIFADFGRQSVAISPGCFTDFINNLWLRSPLNPFSGTNDNATAWRRIGTTDVNAQIVYVSGDEAGHIANGTFVPSLTGGWVAGTSWASPSPVGGSALTNAALFTKSGAAALAVSAQSLRTSLAARVGARNWNGEQHPITRRVVQNVTAATPYPSTTWFGTTFDIGSNGDTFMPDELRGIGATVTTPAAGKLVVTLPAAATVLPAPTGRAWSEVDVYVLDAFTETVEGGEDLATITRAGANWDTPFTISNVTRAAIRRSGALEGGAVTFEDIPPGNYVVRVVYRAGGGVEMRLHSGRPFAVAAPALITSDILTTLAAPVQQPRIYMAGAQHVVVDVHDASLTYGQLVDASSTLPGATVYRLADRDQPRKQTWGARTNIEPWWTGFNTPEGTAGEMATVTAADPDRTANFNPIENAQSNNGTVAENATATPVAGMVASNWTVKINSGSAVAPSDVWRWSAMEQATRSSATNFPQVMRHRHRITLRLPSAVSAGDTVTVTFTAGGVTAELSCVAGATTPSDLIGVSQAGYEAAAPKTAILGQWLGARPSSYVNDAAAALQNVSTNDTTGTPSNWTLRNVDTGASAASGAWVAQAGGDSVTLDGGLVHTTGATVWLADFSAVTTPGRYRLEQPNVGCSPVFEVRAGILRDVARVIANSLTLTRRDQTQNWTGSHWRQPGYDARNLRWNHLRSAIRQQNTDEGPGGGAGRADKYKTLNNDPTMRVLSVAGSPNATIVMATDQDWTVGTSIGTANLSGSDPTWWGRSYTIQSRVDARTFVINAAAPASGIGPLGAGDPLSLTDIRADAGTSQARAARTIIPFGGWRDAADADHRAQHGQAARQLILAALASTAMRTATLNQPEADGYSRTLRLLGTGTTFQAPAGMSHFLREAAWHADAFTDLQLADGWVRGGAELSDYLNTSEGGTGLAIPARIASYVYAPEAYATWEHCATAAMMAFALDRQHPGNLLADRYRTSAIAAWAQCSSAAADAELAADNRSSAVNALRLMAPLCLWLMTPGSGGNAYRDEFYARLDAETNAIAMAEPLALWFWALTASVIPDPGGGRIATWASRARTVGLNMAVGAANVRPFAGMWLIAGSGDDANNGRFSNSLAVPNRSAERGLMCWFASAHMSTTDRDAVRAIVGPFAMREMLYGLGANPSGATTISGLGARPAPSFVYRDYEALGAEVVPHGLPAFGPVSQAGFNAQTGVFDTARTRRTYPQLMLTPWPANWNGQRNFAPMSEWTPFACHADWIGTLLLGHLAYGVDA